MELNGIANIKAILDIAKDECMNGGFVTGDNRRFMIKKTDLQDIDSQLILLEKYFMAINSWIISNKISTLGLPKWHEVRDNSELYPTAKSVIYRIVNHE